ncbi:MAG TPA: nitrilase-related carbon-nitrogen hydrolase, partial [Acidimicrobiales bacterium]
PVGRIAVVISWEDFFGNRARDGVQAGGELLINPTNGSTYTGTSVQTQQVASSRLRAIETGRWEVQISPTGFSEFVTPSGKVLERTSVSEQAVRVHRVALRTGRTWYVDWGDNPARVVGLLLLLAGWALDRRSHTTPDTTPDTAVDGEPLEPVAP